MKKALQYLFYVWVAVMVTIISVSSAGLLYGIFTGQIH
jgi:hypothetical protein